MPRWSVSSRHSLLRDVTRGGRDTYAKSTYPADPAKRIFWTDASERLKNLLTCYGRYVGKVPME